MTGIDESDSTPSELERIRSRIAPGWPPAIDVGPGWIPMLRQLDDELSDIAPEYVVQQVKSKFGALCFYATPSDDPYDYNEDFKAVIDAACWRSIETCEICGQAAGQYVINLWVSTLCAPHAQERAASHP